MLLKLKFLIVGIWNTFFGYIVFLVLDALLERLIVEKFYPYMIALVLSQVIGIVNSYLSHKFFTFNANQQRISVEEFSRFASVYVGIILLGLILVPLLVEVFEFMPKIAALVIIPLQVVISFKSHKNFSFRS
jgi:putative flippase GtrA